MKRFFAYLLQFLGIASLVVLFATTIWLKFGGDYATLDEWLKTTLQVNELVAPILGILALAALGDIKKADKKISNEPGQIYALPKISDDKPQEAEND